MMPRLTPTSRSQGAFNRLVYLPPAAARGPANAHCMNPSLDFEGIERAYFLGATVEVNSLLTKECLEELRRLAVEGTLFYEPKKTYMGACVRASEREEGAAV